MFEILSSAGISGIYSGFTPALLSACAYSPLYDVISKSLLPVLEGISRSNAAFLPDRYTIVGVLTTLLLFPLQTLSVRMIAASGGSHAYSSLFGVLFETGVLGLWAGAAWELPRTAVRSLANSAFADVKRSILGEGKRY